MNTTPDERNTMTTDAAKYEVYDSETGERIALVLSLDAAVTVRDSMMTKGHPMIRELDGRANPTTLPAHLDEEIEDSVVLDAEADRVWTEYLSNPTTPPQSQKWAPTAKNIRDGVPISGDRSPLGGTGTEAGKAGLASQPNPGTVLGAPDDGSAKPTTPTATCSCGWPLDEWGDHA